MATARREFVTGALAAMIGGRAAFASALPSAKRHPNMVFILADDMGWGDPMVYNPRSGAKTPHIDALARQGMRFTDMHSSSGVCTPSRYSILTGRYCWRTSLKNNVLGGYSPALIEPGRLTVPAMLRRAGYRTAGIGKWHLGLGTAAKADYAQPFHPAPTDQGFDYYFGIPASLDMAPYLYFENDRAVAAPTDHTPGKRDGGVFWREGPMMPGFDFSAVLPTLTRKAVSTIEEDARTPERPFFLYLPLPAPHTPWMPVAPFAGTSQAGLYGDFVQQTDDTVGAVLAALERTGQAEDTIVIFTSDNGAYWGDADLRAYPNHRANADFRGMKADIYEAGHRVPFVVRWPGRIKGGSVSRQIASLTDFMATAAAITGTRLPGDAAEDSFDLLPSLLGEEQHPVRTSIIYHSIDGMFSVREGEWKLIAGLGSGGFTKPARTRPVPGGPAGQLYNLRRDPAETTNLWQQQPAVVARLSALLSEQQAAGRTRPVA